MKHWIRLQVELDESYEPSYLDLLIFVKSIERELNGFPQIKRVSLEDYLLPKKETKQE